MGRHTSPEPVTPTTPTPRRRSRLLGPVTLTASAVLLTAGAVGAGKGLIGDSGPGTALVPASYTSAATSADEVAGSPTARPSTGQAPHSRAAKHRKHRKHTRHHRPRPTTPPTASPTGSPTASPTEQPTTSPPYSPTASPTRTPPGARSRSHGR